MVDDREIPVSQFKHKGGGNENKKVAGTFGAVLN